MEREFSKVLKELESENPFFSELKKRMELNSSWKSIVGDQIAAISYVCENKGTLDVWVSDPVVETEIRFKSYELLEEMTQQGFNFNKMKVKKLRGENRGNR
jgi:hypothetical protein|uniref:DUF721 domain-containing protein n=1 Tax=Mesoaciditoga lauensis TaxID=1495039 RepID=A0A7V3VSR8_9BACT